MLSERSVSLVAVFAVTTLLAGVCGALLVYAYLPMPVSVDVTERVSLPVRVNAPKESPHLPAVTLAVVPRKALKAVPGGFAIADQDVAGFATALTSDGWLAADRSTLAAVADPVVLIPGGTAASASGTIVDAGTGLVFFRVDSKNLEVIAFGDSSSLASGATLFRAFPDKHLSNVNLVTAHARIKSDARDAIRASDSVAERLLLSASFVRGEAGAGLVTDAGALVGITVAGAKGDGSSSVAVPIEIVARTLRNILTSGGVHRPTLGLATVDVSELASRSPELGKAFGATVASVDPSGPAAAAGIVSGDRITSLGNDALDGSRLLSDLLSEYAIGEKVQVSYVRGTEQKTSELTVGQAAAVKK